MKDFICPVCGCKEPHKLERLYPGFSRPIKAESIVTVKNDLFDSRLILRACSKCNAVRADWEKITESKDTTEIEKNKVLNLQKGLEEKKDQIITEEEESE